MCLEYYVYINMYIIIYLHRQFNFIRNLQVNLEASSPNIPNNLYCLYLYKYIHFWRLLWLMMLNWRDPAGTRVCSLGRIIWNNNNNNNNHNNNHNNNNNNTSSSSSSNNYTNTNTTAFLQRLFSISSIPPAWPQSESPLISSLPPLDLCWTPVKKAPSK